MPTMCAVLGMLLTLCAVTPAFAQEPPAPRPKVAIPTAPPNQNGAGQPSSANSQALADNQRKQNEPAELTFGGEVTLGQAYEREIGYGLIFRLTPMRDDTDSGWQIEIVPRLQRAGSPADFAAIATPPYHFANPLNVDTSYGITAAEAVAQSKRPFYFVRTMADFRAAEDAVNLALYTTDAPQAEQDRINDAAGKVEVGSGELRILESRLIPPVGKDPLGKIAWMKFEVKLKFHSGIMMGQVLQ